MLQANQLSSRPAIHRHDVEVKAPSRSDGLGRISSKRIEGLSDSLAIRRIEPAFTKTKRSLELCLPTALHGDEALESATWIHACLLRLSRPSSKLSASNSKLNANRHRL